MCIRDRYEGRIIGNEGRLVIPFYNRDNVLVGVTCRALGDERLRYVSIRIDQYSPMVYNLNNVDITKPIYVTEGPIDSMFLDNAVATGNSDLVTLKNILPLDKMIFIFDNQPRNKELVKIMERATEQNINMVIWPENILEKDINDMILKEIDVHSIISTRSFNGLSLKLEFTKWRKV